MFETAHIETTSQLVLQGGGLAIRDGTVKIWEIATGVCVMTLEHRQSNVHRSTLAVLDGGRLASGSFDRTVKIWEVATGTCLATLEGYGDRVQCLAVLDGGRLASGSAELVIWDPALSDVLQ